MKAKLQSLKMLASRYGAKVVVGVAALGSMAANATAVVDYSGAVTAATTEITASAATGVPLFGLILAIGVGIKIIKKFAR